MTCSIKYIDVNIFQNESDKEAMRKIQTMIHKRFLRGKIKSEEIGRINKDLGLMKDIVEKEKELNRVFIKKMKDKYEYLKRYQLKVVEGLYSESFIDDLLKTEKWEEYYKRKTIGDLEKEYLVTKKEHELKNIPTIYTKNNEIVSVKKVIKELEKLEKENKIKEEEMIDAKITIMVIIKTYAALKEEKNGLWETLKEKNKERMLELHEKLENANELGKKKKDLEDQIITFMAEVIGTKKINIKL